MKANERQRTIGSDYNRVVEIFLDNKDKVRTTERMIGLVYAVPTVSLNNASKYVSYLVRMDAGLQIPNGTPTALENAFLKEVAKRAEPIEPEVVEVEQSFKERYSHLVSEFGKLFREMSQAASREKEDETSH